MDGDGYRTAGAGLGASLYLSSHGHRGGAGWKGPFEIPRWEGDKRVRDTYTVHHNYWPADELDRAAIPTELSRQMALFDKIDTDGSNSLDKVTKPPSHLVASRPAIIRYYGRAEAVTSTGGLID